MNPDGILTLNTETRLLLWKNLIEIIETYINHVSHARVAPKENLQQMRSLLASINFAHPIQPQEAMDFIVRNLWEYQVHTPHPRYFGLFNPAPTTMSIAADALAAAFNPQLATSNHSPFAVELERHLIQTFASLFGYMKEKADGIFTSGGAEANHTALLTALAYNFPELAQKGARGLDRQPTLYLSTQSHHSFVKAARACGLGSDAVRWIPVHDTLQMDVESLARQIARDKTAGFAPFLIAATAGTTNAGVIDPLPPIAEVAAREGLWLHVDAAWGGAAVFVDELRPLLNGIAGSDSITFDAHKWLSVPMAAGIYLTRHPDILEQTFSIATEYMPARSKEAHAIDPYTHSMQWSRRFIGLKVFLSLLVAGWEGYRAVIRHQTDMGDLLRQELGASQWKVVNRTKLPIVCFADGQCSQGSSVAFIEAVARDVVASGQAWISTTRLADDFPVLRACITNYRTQGEDVHALVYALNKARDTYYKNT